MTVIWKNWLGVLAHISKKILEFAHVMVKSMLGTNSRIFSEAPDPNLAHTWLSELPNIMVSAFLIF